MKSQVNGGYNAELLRIAATYTLTTSLEALDRLSAPHQDSDWTIVSGIQAYKNLHAQLWWSEYGLREQRLV